LNNKKDTKKVKIKTKIINEKEDIFTDVIEIPDEYVVENENEDIYQINSPIKKFSPQNKNQQNNLDYLINHNIQIIFDNCLHLILNQQEKKIDPLLKSLKELVNPSVKKNIKFKKKQTDSSMANSVLSTFMQTKESLGASMDENVKRMFDKEKSKYKYRLCFLRSFVSRYIIIINQTSKKVFSNIDNWIINSVSLQSDARKKVINKLKSLLKEKKLINEEKDINHIELDTFEALEELKQKEKNNENKIYERLNVDYLINDDLVNIVIKEEKDPEENKKKRKDDKIVQKNYKIIVPNENRDLFEKFRKIKLSDKFSQIDFAFNIYKFHDLYNSLKIFEVKPNAMNQEVFYENFVKKYIFNKEHPFNDFDEIEDNNIQDNDNLQKNYFKSNRVVFQKTNKDHSPNSSKFPTICKALKSLTSKNIKKLFSLFQFTHPSNEEQKIENEEYDKYIDTSKIFTMLALIGAEVLTENIEKELNTADELMSQKIEPQSLYLY